MSEILALLSYPAPYDQTDLFQVSEQLGDVLCDPALRHQRKCDLEEGDNFVRRSRLRERTPGSRRDLIELMNGTTRRNKEKLTPDLPDFDAISALEALCLLAAGP